MRRLTVIIIITGLVLTNLVLLRQSHNISNEIANLQRSVNAKTSQVIVYKGEDGADALTPIKNVDYFDGVNAVSYDTTREIIKEISISGPKGDKGDTVVGPKGDPAPKLLFRVNPDTKDFEVKYENDEYWQVQMFCSDYSEKCA